MICIGFSGADILIPLGDPIMLFTKLENPLFFLAGRPSLREPSVDIRFGLIVPSNLSDVMSITPVPPPVIVCDCRKGSE